MTGDNTPNDFLKQVQFFWNFLAPVFGGLIVLIFKKWFVRYKIKQQDIFQAKKEFRESLLSEKQLLEIEHREIEEWKPTIDIIESAIDRHKVAVGRFEVYLGVYKRWRLKRAWNKYKCKDYPEIDLWNDCVEYGAGFDPDGTEEKKKRKLARRRINKLLKFAKP